MHKLLVSMPVTLKLPAMTADDKIVECLERKKERVAMTLDHSFSGEDLRAPRSSLSASGRAV